MATTWNPADIAPHVTLSGGNLTATSDGSFAFGSVRGTTSVDAGKSYLEFTFTYSTFSNAFPGLATAAKVLTASGSSGVAQIEMSNGQFQINGSNLGFVDGFVLFVSGDVLCVALDLTNQRIWFRRNAGTWNNSGPANPGTNVGGFDVSAIFTGVAVFPWIQFPNSGPANIILNAGASAFAQAMPSGFASWNSFSDPVPVAGGNYAGGSRSRMIRKRKKGETDDLDLDDLDLDPVVNLRIGRQAYK